jgi:hypothetical protein
LLSFLDLKLWSTWEFLGGFFPFKLQFEMEGPTTTAGCQDEGGVQPLGSPAGGQDQSLQNYFVLQGLPAKKPRHKPRSKNQFGQISYAGRPEAPCFEKQC